MLCRKVICRKSFAESSDSLWRQVSLEPYLPLFRLAEEGQTTERGECKERVDFLPPGAEILKYYIKTWCFDFNEEFQFLVNLDDTDTCPNGLVSQLVKKPGPMIRLCVVSKPFRVVHFGMTGSSNGFIRRVGAQGRTWETFLLDIVGLMFFPIQGIHCFFWDLEMFLFDVFILIDLVLWCMAMFPHPWNLTLSKRKEAVTLVWCRDFNKPRHHLYFLPDQTS